MKTYDPKIMKALMKSIYLGLFVNTLGPVAALLLLVVAKGDGLNVHGEFILPQSHNLQVLFYALLAISIIEFGTTYVVKKKMVGDSHCPVNTEPKAYFEQRIFQISIVIFAFNLSHTFYGFMLYFFGFPIEILLFFVSLTLLGYQLLRPRPKFLMEFYATIVGQEEGRDL